MKLKMKTRVIFKQLCIDIFLHELPKDNLIVNLSTLKWHYALISFQKLDCSYNTIQKIIIKI